MIAVESAAPISPALLFNSEMTVDAVGNWKILYRPRASINFRIAGLMPLAELETYLSAFTHTSEG